MGWGLEELRRTMPRVAGVLAAVPLVVASLAVLVTLLAGDDRAVGAALPAVDAAAIRVVIEAQIAAFQRDDGAEAFSYAAPNIQAQFGTPEAFMRMVRSGYDPVYRPDQLLFEKPVLRDGEWIQPLVVTARDGRVSVALYTMQRQPDGSWRIAGVQLLAGKGQSA